MSPSTRTKARSSGATLQYRHDVPTPPPLMAPLGIFPTLETVTPAIAQQWTADTVNIINRRPRKQLISQYAKDMQEGLWRFTGEPLIFDSKGHLKDGQHRLLALMKAGITMQFLVVRGVDTEAQKYMDSGARRLAQDALTLNGHEHDNVSAANIARSVLYFQSGVRPSQAAVVDFAEKNIEELDQCGRIGRDIRNKIGGSVAVYGAAYWYLSKIDSAKAQEFMVSLETGENLTSDDPRLKLRNYIVRTATIAASRSNTRTFKGELGVIFKAWNAWRTGKEIKLLRWRQDEAFPEPI